MNVAQLMAALAKMPQDWPVTISDDVEGEWEEVNTVVANADKKRIQLNWY